MAKVWFFEKVEFYTMLEMPDFKKVLLYNLADKENLTYKQQHYTNKITKKQANTIPNQAVLIFC